MTLLGGRSPQAVAVLPEEGPAISYGELATRISEFAATYPEAGLAFCLCNNDLPSLLAYLGCLERGVVPLLLPGGLDKGRLLGLIDVYRPKYLFHRRPDLEDLSGTSIGRYDAYILVMMANGGGYPLHPDLALLLTTSGSTGSHKLVRLTLDNLLANADSIVDYLQIDEGERAVTTLPMHYSYGLSVINSHLRAGATVLLNDCSVMERGFWDQVQRDGATSIAGVPYTYEMLLRLGIGRLKMPAVRTMTQAGGRLSPDRIRRVAEACAARNIRFFTMYGQTEATARIAYLPCQDTLARAGSIGKPIPRGSLWLEDEGGNRITVPGTRGELIYAGPNVCLGYASSWRDLAAGDDNHGRLRTGDLAEVDEEGYFTLVGRASRFIKVFGNRVALDDVEAILNQLDFTVAVTGIDDRIDVFLEGHAVPDELRIKLAAILGLNPAAIALSALDRLPRLESGKIDYTALACRGEAVSHVV